MDRDTPKPVIAVVGEFQTGKSLLINALLGGQAVPVGEGLATTRMIITCRWAEVDWAEATAPNGESWTLSVGDFIGSGGEDLWHRGVRDVTLHLHRPLLRHLTLVDTPGINHEAQDDDLARKACLLAGGVLLVLPKTPPGTGTAASFLRELLAGKPWALALNCGRDGPHLEEVNSQAAENVERACLAILSEQGAGTPIFTARLHPGLLLRYHSPIRISQREPGARIANPCHDVRSLWKSSQISQLRDKLISMAQDLNHPAAEHDAARVVRQSVNGPIHLSAADAKLIGETIRLETKQGILNVGFWDNAEDYIVWRVEVVRPGDFLAEGTFACAPDSAGSTCCLEIGSHEYHTEVPSTGSWDCFVTAVFGPVSVDSPGPLNVVLKASSKPSRAVVNLRSVVLRPVK